MGHRGEDDKTMPIHDDLVITLFLEQPIVFVSVKTTQRLPQTAASNLRLRIMHFVFRDFHPFFT